VRILKMFLSDMCRDNMNTLKILLSIIRHTVIDQMKQKSFFVIFIICGFFVLGIKNCYQGNYSINNQQVEAGMIAVWVSKAMFNVIAVVAMMLAALFSMRIIKREGFDGTQSTILSKPVSRFEYIVGKAAGLWIVTFSFMFALHVIIFTIGLIKTGEAMPGFLLASVLCSIDILFVVCFVMLMSLYLPDFACFIIVSAIGLFGYIGDGIYSVSQSRMVQEAVAGNALNLPDISLWKIIYLTLPQLSTMQLFASSFISNESFKFAGPIHPMINIVLYCTVCIGLLLVLFRKQDVA
jgi:ABC-type transport system involved in multi-copper enzyme maturation permease subunit